MPKFFVTTNDGKSIVRDEEGLEFKTRKAATDDAQRALVDMAREQLPNGDRVVFMVQVQDEIGDEVYRASLKFAANKVKGKASPPSEYDAGDADELPLPPSKA